MVPLIIEASGSIMGGTEFGLANFSMFTRGETDCVGLAHGGIVGRNRDSSDVTADNLLISMEVNFGIGREGLWTKTAAVGVQANGDPTIVLELGKDNRCGLGRIKLVVRGRVDFLGNRMIKLHGIGVLRATNGNPCKGMGFKLGAGTGTIFHVTEETNREKTKEDTEIRTPLVNKLER
jgi:hypothetical protein